MKLIKALCLAGLLAGSIGYGAELSDADSRWRDAVDKMITQGQYQVSTPEQRRVQIARDLGAKHGLKADVAKTDSGFRISFKHSGVTAK